ncbi:MAG: tail fiber assembly protein [Enterobacteriaceae bacterium]
MEYIDNTLYEAEITSSSDQLTPQDAAAQELANRRIIANHTIAPLQDAVDLGIATVAEAEQLQEWKTYRVLLSRIDPEQAADIEWPTRPQ